MRAPLYSEIANEVLCPSAIEDPHPLFSRLRKEHPISRIGETGVHLLANWLLIDEALSREGDFSANLTGVLMRSPDGSPACFDLSISSAANVIATADEPEHSVHRKLARPRLAPTHIAALECKIRGWARDALRPWIADGGGDAAPLSETVPALAVAEILGLPKRDVQRFRIWSMIGGDILAGNVSTEALVRLANETGRMVEYLGEHFDAATRNPITYDDAPMLHALARGVESGLINRQQALGIAVVMFGAGGESTSALIGSTLRMIAEHPSIADTLRDQPELIPRFVEEVIRLEPPFKFHYRAVKRRCQLGGFDLEPGDRLMLLWASANRDASIFDDPDGLRLDRRHPKRHMSFGRGGHFCIGAPLARLEARVMLEELLAQTKQVSMSGHSSFKYANSIFVRRLERLEIDVEALP